MQEAPELRLDAGVLVCTASLTRAECTSQDGADFSLSGMHWSPSFRRSALTAGTPLGQMHAAVAAQGAACRCLMCISGDIHRVDWLSHALSGAAAAPECCRLGTLRDLSHCALHALDCQLEVRLCCVPLELCLRPASVAAGFGNPRDLAHCALHAFNACRVCTCSAQLWHFLAVVTAGLLRLFVGSRAAPV